jgi:hypothetical protein
MKNHLCDNNGRCTCPAWKNGTARTVPAWKLEVFSSFPKNRRCKICDKLAARWLSKSADSKKMMADGV